MEAKRRGRPPNKKPEEATVEAVVSKVSEALPEIESVVDTYINKMRELKKAVNGKFYK